MIPTATSNIGHMEILAEQKLCRKGLHWYPVTGRRCKQCHKVKCREWYLANHERKRKCVQKWKQDNPERTRENLKKWRQNNPERNREYVKKWRQNNPELKRECEKRYNRNNKGIRNAYQARKRAVKKNALAPWANVGAVKDVYIKARRLTKLTGVKHHVDHVYPLQSEYMCGLHVETNLQILTEKENIAKGNRTWPGQLECQKGSVYARFPKELTYLLNDQQT